MATGAIVVSRLRKDAALFDLPPAKRGDRGRPRKYGTRKLSLPGRGTHRQGWTQARMVLYGVEQTVTFKTFLATYRAAGGVIRVVIVKRSAQLFAEGPSGWVAFFCTDTTVPAETIIECVADRSAIEQNFHDVKEVHGAGQQQVRWRVVQRGVLESVPVAAYAGGVVVVAAFGHHAPATIGSAVGRALTPAESRRPLQNPEKTGAPRIIFGASPPLARQTKNPGALQRARQTRPMN